MPHLVGQLCQDLIPELRHCQPLLHNVVPKDVFLGTIQVRVAHETQDLDHKQTLLGLLEGCLGQGPIPNMHPSLDLPMSPRKAHVTARPPTMLHCNCHVLCQMTRRFMLTMRKLKIQSIRTFLSWSRTFH